MQAKANRRDVSANKKRRGARPAASQRIVDTAATEFLKHGYDRTSVEAIARRAKVSKATIYRAHRNKKELFRAALMEFAVKSSRSGFENLASDTRSPAVVLREVARNIMEFYLRRGTRRFIRIIIAEAARFPEITNDFRMSMLEKTYGPIERYFMRLHDEGVIHRTDYRYITSVFSTLAIYGFVFLQSEPRNNEADYAHIDGAIDLFMNGCFTRTAIAGQRTA